MTIKKQNWKLVKDFQTAVQNHLLLDDEGKKYWLENCENLPPSFLRSVYRLLKAQNCSIEKYIHIALENDSDHTHLTAIKTKIKKLQRETMEIDEKVQSDEADEILKEMQ